MHDVRFRWPLALGGLTLAAFGCSSVGGSDALFSGGQSGQGGADTTTASTTSATTGIGGASTTATTASTTTTTASTTGASTTATASTATTTSSTSTGGDTTTMPCGSDTCAADGLHACCWDGYGTSSNEQATCVFGQAGADKCNTYAAAGGYETLIECSDSSQCGGDQVCCGHRVTAGVTYYDAVTCEDSCDYPDVFLCQPGDDCPDEESPSGTVATTCGASTLLPPDYYVCRTN